MVLDYRALKPGILFPFSTHGSCIRPGLKRSGVVQGVEGLLVLVLVLAGILGAG
jgi:hypothetical protein